jgi:hypothetical protein
MTEVATTNPAPRHTVPGSPAAYAAGQGIRDGTWLTVIRRYLLVLVLGNLVWEFAQMPLYTLWLAGTPGEIAFAALHCTGGDLLIGLSALVAGLLVAGTGRWPAEDYGRVALVAIVIGIGYTVFSEWLNIEIRESWAYRDLMPVVPVIDAGLSPIAQWIVVPTTAFWWARPTAAGTREQSN